MPLSRRYSPEWSPGESSSIGMDFSFLVPPGDGINAGALSVWTNVANPQPSADFTVGVVGVLGRTIYATLSGGVDGTDYQLRWIAYDTRGNAWPRTALLLCSLTS